jgi:hypothetical protein
MMFIVLLPVGDFRAAFPFPDPLREWGGPFRDADTHYAEIMRARRSPPSRIRRRSSYLLMRSLYLFRFTLVREA